MKLDDFPVGQAGDTKTKCGSLKGANAPAFSFGMHCELAVTGYTKAVLSVPAIALSESLRSKDLLAAGEVSADGKYTLEQHLQHLHSQGMIEEGRPLLVFGARNNLVNFRCPVVLKGKVHAVEGEEPLKTQRPYYGIGFRDGRVHCDTLLAGGSEPEVWDFFCAGIPVLWDDLAGDELFDLLLCETADHSHLFDLPRGNHPAATDASRNAWQTLQNVFVKHLHDGLSTTADAMRQTLADFSPPLERCSDYFHAIMGIRGDGELICLFAQGRFEDLGNILRQRGCTRAVCLENSGSVMPAFLPKGIKGNSIPLVRAPNFRPKGRTIIAIELNNPGFSAQALIG